MCVCAFVCACAGPGRTQTAKSSLVFDHGSTSDFSRQLLQPITFITTASEAAVANRLCEIRPEIDVVFGAEPRSASS